MINYCIANWKMNLTIEESVLFTEELQKKDLENYNTQIILCPSFISLKDVKKSFLNSKIQIGAQNIIRKPHIFYLWNIQTR